jgi:hypothetical protein
MNGLQILKDAVSMKRTHRSIELENGSLFEWWMTPLTLAQRERATRLAGKNSEDPITVALNVLVLKAENQEGNKLFVLADLAELKNDLPETVISALVVEVFRDTASEADLDGERVEVDLSQKKSLNNSRKTGS